MPRMVRGEDIPKNESIDIKPSSLNSRKLLSPELHQSWQEVLSLWRESRSKLAIGEQHVQGSGFPFS